MNVEQHRTLDSKNFLLLQVPRVFRQGSCFTGRNEGGVGIHGGLLISLAKKKEPSCLKWP